MGFLGFGRKKRPAPLVLADEPAPPPPAVEPVAAAPDPEPEPDPAPVAARPTPDEALAELKAGNEAFLKGESNLGHVLAHDLEPLQGGQNPIAAIVGCADSRTPPTILFNQGFGKLFIIRVAGNTVERRGLSSLIYAVKHLHCPLIVVMGHTGCGAVGAAEAVVDGAPLDPSLEEMIVPIIPAVLTARKGSPADPAVAAVEENARWVAHKLATADSTLSDAVEAGTLRIVAAVKDMASGRVRFLDGAA